MLAIEDVFRQPVTNVAFMGMGEPLMNIGAVLDAHRTISKVCIGLAVVPRFRKACILKKSVQFIEKLNL